SRIFSRHAVSFSGISVTVSVTSAACPASNFTPGSKPFGAECLRDTEAATVAAGLASLSTRVIACFLSRQGRGIDSRRGGGGERLYLGSGVLLGRGVGRGRRLSSRGC